MPQPLVSFIIAYYNLPLTMLCECIDSIMQLPLTTAEREIIVVDDGSDLSPMNELMRYGDNIIYIRQNNKGLSEARNTGIQMAKGSYLQFVDADDTLLLAPYTHCLDLLRRHQPEMVIFRLTHTPKTDAKPAWHDSEPTTGCDYMRRQNIRGSACGYLFSRSILGDLRFKPGIYNEDEEFTPQLLLRAETIRLTDAQAYNYRLRPGSIINSKTIRQRLKRLEDTRSIICRLSTIADRQPVDSRTALQRRVAQLTMDYLYNIILLTGSRHYLERKMAQLRQKGLFPLPDRDYTTKYSWFRRLSNTSPGISVLMRVVKFTSSFHKQ